MAQIVVRDFTDENVDWKFFNYLVDKATLISDNLDSDYHLKIHVCICEGEYDNKYTLYHMDIGAKNGEYNNEDRYLYDYLLNLFKSHGLSYFISLRCDRPDNKKYMKSIIEKYLLSIENKCNIINYSYYLCVVRPI